MYPQNGCPIGTHSQLLAQFYVLSVDVDECATDVDSCQDVCTNTDGGYNCSCSNGDLNTDAHTCTSEYLIYCKVIQ